MAAAALPKRSFSGGTLRHRGSGDTQGSQQTHSYTLHPIALEPTDDGVAVIGTVLIQLPGGGSAPNQACLGSVLTSMRQLYGGERGHHGVKNSSSTVIQSRGSSTA